MTPNADYVTCADCRRVYVPTPWDDHYEPAWGGPRLCYGCLLRQANNESPLPPTDGSEA
jgi:hypothetical protein